MSFVSAIKLYAYRTFDRKKYFMKINFINIVNAEKAKRFILNKENWHYSSLTSSSDYFVIFSLKESIIKNFQLSLFFFIFAESRLRILAKRCLKVREIRGAKRNKEIW